MVEKNETLLLLTLLLFHRGTAFFYTQLSKNGIILYYTGTHARDNNKYLHKNLSSDIKRARSVQMSPQQAFTFHKSHRNGRVTIKKRRSHTDGKPLK